jgi:5-histidylcysteine sulfoxide synthase/putative 4-mercaptohistidine N1-methyltranferase
MPVTLTGTDPDQKRHEIREYFHKTYDLFERMFDLLKSDEVFYLQSEPTRHPMIFYFGHTAAFYINKLMLGKVIDERINPDFESIFAIGVDEMSWDDLDERNYRWPEVDAVRRYRNEVRNLVNGLISSLPLTLPITEEDPFWIILMGIEHERIHIETSSVLHRQMPIKQIADTGFFHRCRESVEAPENSLVPVEGATMTLGKGHGHHLFGWDNEYGTQTVEVASFKASKYLVSNGEFLSFVEAGGYETARYWDEEGKTFLKIRKAEHPTFWEKDRNGRWRYRALAEVMEMPWDWPVDVNCLEARAFCRWKSEQDGKHYRLPTEAEWYRLYERAGIRDVPDFDDTKANINLRYFASSCPVDKFAFGDLFDVVGNVWQWTETAIDGFEGFAPHPIYDDFSTPTFDGKHNVIKGGSWISTGNEIMKHSRYAFRRHFTQHAGFRYLEAEPLKEAGESHYENDMAVSQYCEFHYGAEHFNVGNFPRACAEMAARYTADCAKGSALDLGCATGRLSFELAKQYERVTGIDFSARFIQVGVALQRNGRIVYERHEEGRLTSTQEHTLGEFGLEGVREKVTFWQGDACNLKPHFTGYDLLIATNLIDRLYEPRLFLEQVHERINEAGVLILTSPYTWLEEHTKKEHWLGGYKDESGNEVHTFETLKALLSEHFDLIGTENIPFVIRETPRKFQYTVSHMSVWKRR